MKEAPAIHPLAWLAIRTLRMYLIQPTPRNALAQLRALQSWVEVGAPLLSGETRGSCPQSMRNTVARCVRAAESAAAESAR